MNRESTSAYTIVELLVVMAIIMAMASLAIPAFNGMNTAHDLTKTAYEISDTLAQARAYAMANNTYVFVGIEEVDASVSASAKPQRTTGSHPYGRVAIVVVASKNGTRGYDASSSVRNPAWHDDKSWINLEALSKLQRFENIHIAADQLPMTGALKRPAITTLEYIIGNKSCLSWTPFAWPLGTEGVARQYTFSKVISFDPQGVARIQGSSNSGDTDSIVAYMEIGLQEARGNIVSTSPNVAAIQIDAITGATRIYRP